MKRAAVAHLLARMGLSERRACRIVGADAKDFDWNKGGRLIALGKDSYQSMGPALRQSITINGEAIAEIDIKASHLTIFYAICKQTLDPLRDPYAVEGVPRDVVKSFINSVFGQGRMPKKWSGGICTDYKADHERSIGKDFPFEATKLRILNRHSFLLSVESTGVDWAVLQYLGHKSC